MAEKEKVLILDDNSRWLRSLESMLGSEYDLTLVQNREEAISAVKNNDYALVILDWRLTEEYTGLDVLIKMREYVPDLRAIVLTGYPNSSDAVASLRAGVLDFISKGGDGLGARLLEAVGKYKKKTGTGRKGINLFYSYVSKDESFRSELETHLKILQQRGIIREWSDREIDAGQEWRKEISSELEKADIILLLVSPDFLASGYVYETEMKGAIERHERGDTRLIPVIVRESAWQETPFSAFKMPNRGKPISSWRDEDKAWRNVAEEIERIAVRIRKGGTERDSNLVISKVALSNIRCYERASLSFENGGEVCDFALLFGDNGTGKSTFLRSIALGLCDINTATAFMEDQPGSLLRDNKNKGKISIEFVSPTSRKRWTVTTELKRNKKGEIILSQDVPEDLPRDKIFACGYGSSRRGFGTQDYTDYSLKNSLGTLFNYELSLQNPELALLRMGRMGIPTNRLLQKIDAILTLEAGSTVLDGGGIQISGPWGQFMPLGSLGDGFQATLAWVADMLGCALFHSPEAFDDELSGIVIVDELEQHLHPSWQREIINLLNQQFPKIQFIACSHSPMCALGLTALPEKKAKLFHLNQQDDSVELFPAELPMGQRADQTLTSPLFGLFSASGFDVSAAIEEFTSLSAKKKRSPEENSRLIALDEKLETVFDPHRNEIEKEIDRAIRVVLDDQITEKLGSGKFAEKALNFNVRNRISKFFED